VETPIASVYPPKTFDSLLFVYGSVKSLLHNIPERGGVIYRPIYEANANSPEIEPLNTEVDVLSGISNLVTEREAFHSLPHRPYWDRSKKYNIAEVFGSSIQSFDLHDEYIPTTTLPPEEDVLAFIQGIRDRPERVTVPEQFRMALDLAGNDIFGATNICWITNRFMARGVDSRAYPNIPIDASMLYDWNDQVAQFKTYDQSGKNDGPGDNYYFWTHVFGAVAFSERGPQAKLAQLAFSHGTQIMTFVRKNIATGNQPNITAHEPASSIGRKVGLMLKERTSKAPELSRQESSYLTNLAI
jgi:hypothetical protein